MVGVEVAGVEVLPPADWIMTMLVELLVFPASSVAVIENVLELEAVRPTSADQLPAPVVVAVVEPVALLTLMSEPVSAVPITTTKSAAVVYGFTVGKVMIGAAGAVVSGVEVPEVEVAL